MTLDHEQIQEVLAGHALRALDGEDEREAERLLAEHVPGCPECRQAVEDFSAVSADLALAAPAAAPPDILLPRLRRELGIGPSRRSRVAAALAAVGVAAIAGLAFWNVMLNNQVSDLAGQRDDLTGVSFIMSRADVRNVAVATKQPPQESLVISYEVDDEAVWMWGSNLPGPADGNEFRLWVERDGEFVHVASFVPEDGVVIEEWEMDATTWDAVLITEEPQGREEAAPGGQRLWYAEVRVDEESATPSP